MAEDLSNLDRLIKFMKMTDAEDNVALVAMRKANAMLKSEGWDWDKLLRGKVKVLADPFATGPQVAAPPPRTAQPMDLRPASPPPPQPAANPWPGSQRPQPRPKPAQPTHPPRPAAKPVAPAGPCTFKKGDNNAWYIASPTPLTATQLGLPIDVHKRDGSIDSVVPLTFASQNAQGYYLYDFQASKHKKKYADTQTLGDFI